MSFAVVSQDGFVWMYTLSTQRESLVEPAPLFVTVKVKLILSPAFPVVGA